MTRALLRVFGWLLAPWLRGRAVRAALAEHDAYAYDRVHSRKRLGFDAWQREEAVLQRARRALSGTGVRVSLFQVRKILEGD